jgi:protein involved in polysaccharide export with SLBB domain
LEAVSAGQSANQGKSAPKEILKSKSEFEKYISGNKSASPSLEIRQFGYELFEDSPSTFAPIQDVPVGPEFVVGPGDTIKIEIWGKIEGSWNLAINNEGNISLPKIGVVGVAGLTFKELKELIQTKLTKYYTGFEMNISMGSLRTIQVYVVGNAQRPGAYTVSSLSTIINALFKSGGPSKSGSMRTIQVKRNGKTITSFDLYDFLLNGDKSKDIRLMPEDVIFIPPTGPQVGIVGNVKSPAIYELKNETRLLDLIRMAGGITGIAFTGRVQMQRVQNHHSITLFEGDLIDIEQNRDKDFILQDGDLAKIFTVADLAKTITVSGAVVNPGSFGITPGMTKVKDVIKQAGGLFNFTSNQAEMTRITVTQNGPKTERFTIDLAKALDEDSVNNIAFQENDYLLVRTIPEWSLNRTATISGEVRYPGSYTIKKGETLSSLIERAGGFTDRAYLRGVVFTREQIRKQQQKQIDEMTERLERDLLGTGTAQVSTASSTDDARMAQLELEQKRQFIAKLKTVKSNGRIALRLSDLSTFRGSAYDIEIEHNDSISVPSDQKTVQVIGSVYNQSAFVYEPAEGYDYYVDLAGGYTSNADQSNVYILQANGTTSKAKRSFLASHNKLNSGDTIVIPENLDRVAWMRNIKDITQIFYQIAVTTGVMLLLF